MKKGFYCDKDGEILLITKNESNNFEVKSNNSQCGDCVHNEICQFYNALGVKVICYPCGFYEAKSNEELFKQALVEGVNRHIDKTIEKEKQIEEIANDINMHCCSLAEQFCGETSCNACLTNFLYNAGYRKQNVGEWISNELGGYEYAFYCSECGWVDGYPFNDRHKFCPNCGAKMKGGEE